MYDSLQVLQRDVECHGRIVSSVVRLCGGGDAARALERRWHLLYLRAIEWQCHLEACLAKTDNQGCISIEEASDSDEEPALKQPRLSRRGSPRRLRTPQPRIRNRSFDSRQSASEEETDDVLTCTWGGFESDYSWSRRADSMEQDEHRVPDLTDSGPPETLRRLHDLSTQETETMNFHEQVKTPPTVVKRKKPVDTSKFNQSDRKSKNCATFYFRHHDTDSDGRQMIETDEKSQESSEEEWTYVGSPKIANEDSTDLMTSSVEIQCELPVDEKKEKSPSPKPKLESNTPDLIKVDARCKDIERLVIQAEELVQKQAQQQMKKKGSRSFKPLMFEEEGKSVSRVKMSRIKEWLNQSTEGERSKNDSNQCTESYDASGEYTTESEVDTSLTSEERNLHSSMDMSTSTCTVTPTHQAKVQLRKKRSGPRPWSVSCLSQLPAPPPPAISHNMSISESALHTLAAPPEPHASSHSNGKLRGSNTTVQVCTLCRPPSLTTWPSSSPLCTRSPRRPSYTPPRTPTASCAAATPRYRYVHCAARHLAQHVHLRVRAAYARRAARAAWLLGLQRQAARQQHHGTGMYTVPPAISHNMSISEFALHTFAAPPEPHASSHSNGKLRGSNTTVQVCTLCRPPSRTTCPSPSPLCTRSPRRPSRTPPRTPTASCVAATPQYRYVHCAARHLAQHVHLRVRSAHARRTVRATRLLALQRQAAWQQHHSTGMYTVPPAISHNMCISESALHTLATPPEPHASSHSNGKLRGSNTTVQVCTLCRPPSRTTCPSPSPRCTRSPRRPSRTPPRTPKASCAAATPRYRYVHCAARHLAQHVHLRVRAAHVRRAARAARLVALQRQVARQQHHGTGMYTVPPAISHMSISHMAISESALHTLAAPPEPYASSHSNGKLRGSNTTVQVCTLCRPPSRTCPSPSPRCIRSPRRPGRMAPRTPTASCAAATPRYRYVHCAARHLAHVHLRVRAAHARRAARAARLLALQRQAARQQHHGTGMYTVPPAISHMSISESALHTLAAPPEPYASSHSNGKLRGSNTTVQGHVSSTNTMTEACTSCVEANEKQCWLRRKRLKLRKHNASERRDRLVKSLSFCGRLSPEIEDKNERSAASDPATGRKYRFDTTSTSGNDSDEELIKQQLATIAHLRKSIEKTHISTKEPDSAIPEQNEPEIVTPSFKLGPEGGHVRPRLTRSTERERSFIALSLGDPSQLWDLSIDKDSDVDKSVTAGTEEHSSFSEQAWDFYQEKYNSEPYSEAPDSDAARRLLEFGDDYRAYLDSQSDCCSSLSAQPEQDRSPTGTRRRRPPSEMSRERSLPRYKRPTRTSPVETPLRKPKKSISSAERKKMLLDSLEKSRNSVESNESLRRRKQSESERKSKRSPEFDLLNIQALSRRRHSSNLTSDEVNSSLEYTEVNNRPDILDSLNRRRKNTDKDGESELQKVALSELRRKSTEGAHSEDEASSPKKHSRRNWEGDSDSESEEVRSLIRRSSSQLEAAEAAMARQDSSPDLLRAFDYTEIVTRCRENINLLDAALADGSVLSSGLQRDIRGL
ncbi:unnamed protein product [Parnassius apollo]|uniref:(apollo) hypothetical protein n=1 Tax=Parnassius apollo TaxID=110799 RepID=A0A8S3WFH5_PARAO|nr:unnamed protein product [Parnassius apollo]